MSSDDPVLEQSLQCLLAHLHPEWGDRSGLDVFNRLLAKNVRPPGWTRNTHFTICPGQVSSRRESWATDDLGKLRRGHGWTHGDDFDCPIIIAEYEGEQRVLDGNHRINRWVELKDSRPHDVNIHAISGTSQYVELPHVEDGA